VGEAGDLKSLRETPVQAPRPAFFGIRIALERETRGRATFFEACAPPGVGHHACGARHSGLLGRSSHRRGGDRLPPNARTLSSRQDDQIVCSNPDSWRAFYAPLPLPGQLRAPLLQLHRGLDRLDALAPRSSQWRLVDRMADSQDTTPRPSEGGPSVRYLGLRASRSGTGPRRRSGASCPCPAWCQTNALSSGRATGEDLDRVAVHPSKVRQAAKNHCAHVQLGGACDPAF
jgi:hypothetical protein